MLASGFTRVSKFSISGKNRHGDTYTHTYRDPGNAIRVDSLSGGTHTIYRKIRSYRREVSRASNGFSVVEFGEVLIQGNWITVIAVTAIVRGESDSRWHKVIYNWTPIIPVML
jgi:hypothetical protein